MAASNVCERVLSTLSCYPAKSTKAVIQLNLLLPHVSRMPKTVPFHKHAHPFHIDLFGAQALVFVTISLVGLIQQPCGVQRRFHG
jgi:hypothetical protein